MPINQFLVPYLRRHRFWEAAFNSRYKVFPLWPGHNNSIPQSPGLFVDRQTKDDKILDLDEGYADIGFPTGAINQTTVIEVTSVFGQEWMDYLELEPGARIWTPSSRFYLFDYIEPSALPETKRPVTGLRIVNDGEWIPYPGSLMDGHLVHWEQDPWAVGTHPLPAKYWDVYL